MIKKLYLAIAILSICSVMIYSQRIPLQNQVILDDISGSFLYPSKTKIWIPSKEQTSKAISKIYEYIDKYDESDLSKIIKAFDRYKVQFIGIYLDSKPIIYCNFLLENIDGWRKYFVQVMDGGFSFWKIEYWIESNECKGLYINGYA